ncbi:MAG: signal peptidase I [Ilumatobacteraceae bacterium]
MHGRHDTTMTVDHTEPGDPAGVDEPTVPDAPMSARHALWHFVMSSVLILLLGAIVTLWPASLGGRTTIVFVSGTSMSPTLTQRDVVIAREHARYAVGDLVVFRVPEGEAAGEHVIHRIIGGSSSTGWVTQGDNRTSVDPWFISDDDVVGLAERKAAVGPALRTVFRWFVTPLVWSIAGAVFAYVVVLRYLRERDAALARETQSTRNSSDSTA